LRHLNTCVQECARGARRTNFEHTSLRMYVCVCAVVCDCMCMCAYMCVTTNHAICMRAEICSCPSVCACVHAGTTWPRRDGVALVCPDQCVTPTTKIDQCTQKTRARHAHAKWLVLDHPVSRPDKICTHAQTCQRDARRRRAFSRIQPAVFSNACSGIRTCVSGAAACVSDAAAAPEATNSTREHKHAGQRGQGTRTMRGPLCCVQCEQHAS